jgi:hypothetical protein
MLCLSNNVFMPNFKTIGLSVGKFQKIRFLLILQYFFKIFRGPRFFLKKTLKQVSNYFSWSSFCNMNRDKNSQFWQHCCTKLLKKPCFFKISGNPAGQTWPLTNLI